MIVAMEPEHLVYVSQNLRDGELKESLSLKWGDSLEHFVVDRMEVDGAKFTISLAGEPVMVFGATFCSPRVATIWMISTDKIGSVIKEAIRFWRKELLPKIWEARVHRVEIEVMESNTKAIKFAKRMGFEYEGTKQCAGKDQENICFFGLVRRDNLH